MRGVSLRDVGALWALWMSCVALKAQSINYVGLVCRMTPWKTQCKNHIQAHVMGLSLISYGDVSEAADCMVYATEEECNSAVTLKRKAPCAWCTTPSYYRTEFGEGGCTLKRMKDLGGCGYLPKLLYDPAIATNIPTPTVTYEGRCLKRSASAGLCETNEKLFNPADPDTFPCRYCEVEDAYGIKKPSTNLCLPVTVTNPSMDPAQDWCRLLNDLPSNIVEKNLDWGHSAMYRNRSYRLRRDAAPGFRVANVVVKDAVPDVAAESARAPVSEFPTNMVLLLHELVSTVRPEPAALYRDARDSTGEEATLPDSAAPSQSEVSAKTSFLGSATTLSSEAKNENRPFDSLFASEPTRNLQLKRHPQVPILFRRSGTMAIPPILTIQSQSNRKRVNEKEDVLTVPCLLPGCSCPGTDSQDSPKGASKISLSAESSTPAEMKGLADRKSFARPIVHVKGPVTAENVRRKPTKASGPIESSTTPVQSLLDKSISEDQEPLVHTSTSSEIIIGVAETSAVISAPVNEEMGAESRVPSTDKVTKYLEVAATAGVETSSKVLSTEEAQTGVEPEVITEVEALSEMPATKEAHPLSAVPATTKVETLSKVAAIEEPQPLSGAPATTEAETLPSVSPTTLPSVPAATEPQMSPKVPITEGVHTLVAVPITRGEKTVSEVPATKGVETPTAPPSKMEVTRSTVPAVVEESVVTIAPEVGATSSNPTPLVAAASSVSTKPPAGAASMTASSVSTKPPAGAASMTASSVSTKPPAGAASMTASSVSTKPPAGAASMTASSVSTKPPAGAAFIAAAAPTST